MIDATLLAQISDPHVDLNAGDPDSSAGLEAAVRGVLELKPLPDAVIVTGDLANGPSANEYERVRELLAPLPMAVHVIPGNHDDPSALHQHFPLAGAGEGDYRYSTTVDSLRIVACDTTVAGSDGGSLGSERLAWLEAELAAEPETPTVVAMHHPPLLTGISLMDEIVLPRSDRDALGGLFSRNRQVRAAIAGHVHRAAFWTLGSCGVITCPSTWLQAPLEIPGGRLTLVDEPAAFALHALLGAEFVSHIQPLTR